LASILIYNRVKVKEVEITFNPDTSFGSSGRVFTDLSRFDSADAVAVQRNGKIVVAGCTNNDKGLEDLDFLLARYNGDGTFDTSFGSDGIVISNFKGRDWAHAITVQSDGKIIAAGESDGTFAVARYNVDGKLDTSFGNNGLATIAFDNRSYKVARAIILEADGKIVAAGDAWSGNSNSFALARYNSDGTLDAGFGSNGLVTSIVWGSALAVALQPDRKIVVAGDDTFSFVLARYNSDGTLDSGFGSNGSTKTNFSKINEFGGIIGEIKRAVLRAIAVQPDGKIVAAGSVSTESRQNIPSYGLRKDGSVWSESSQDTPEAYAFALARYDSDGRLDAGFGSNGLVTSIFKTNYTEQVGVILVAVQSNRKIIAVGVGVGSLQHHSYHQNNQDNYFILVRYNSDGKIDTSFGFNGAITDPLPSGVEMYRTFFGHAAAIQSDGKIVVVGEVRQLKGKGGNNDVMLTRLK
jgi:uncharacterized delta-60 repeat protein